MDIAGNPEEKKILELIVAASEEFLQSAGSEINYQKITDNILYISGAKYASFNLYDEDGGKFKTVAFSAPKGIVKKASSLFGFKFLDKSWEHDPARAEKIKSNIITHFSSLIDLQGDFIYKPMASLLEKTFDFGEVALVKILKENVMLGDFTLIMPRDVRFKNDTYIELYTRQVGLLITRKRSDDALQKSEEKFSRAFHSGTILMAISTVQEGLYIDINDAFLKALGFKREEVIGRKSSDLNIFAKKEQREEIRKIFLREGSVSNAEVLIKGHDGLVHTGIFTADPIDVEGTPCWLTTMTDITERKTAERALKESEEKYRSLVERANDGVAVLLNGIIMLSNPRMAEMLGYKTGEIDGLELARFILPEKLQFEMERYRSKMAGKKLPPVYETEVLDRSGNRISVEVNGAVIQYEGKSAELVLIRDITERKQAEEALRLSTERHRTILRTAVNGFWLVDMQGRLLEINDAYCRMSGYSMQELLSMSIPDLEVIEKNSDTAARIQKIIKQGEEHFESRHRRKDGSIYDVEVSVQYQAAEGGRFVAFLHDITERKKTENALRASEERYRKLFSSVGEGIVLIAPDGQILQANPAAEHILGLKLSDIKERKYDSTDWEMIRSDGTPMPPEEMAGPRAMAEKHSVKDVVMGAKRPDGSVSWINVSAEPIFDEAGELQGVVGTFVDVTDRKKAEEELCESEEKYRILVEKVNEAILIVQEGVFIFANQKAHELMSVPDGGFLGRSFIDFVWHEDKEMVISNYMKRMAGEIVADSYDFRIIGTEGQQIWVFMTVAITQYKGKPATLIMVTNITERKKAEEEILHLSFHDHLTGLYNRRYFDEELKRLDTQRQLPLSFIMGDINGLKIINDVFGHTRGDELLRETAEILKRVCRSDDILARWGGDEFVILLPKTSVADSEEIVERIKKECKKTDFQKIPISLSLGAAIKETTEQLIQTVVIDAESNMYRNKLVEKASLTSSIIFALEQALYEKSNETKEHTDRMLKLSIKLGKSVNLPSHQLDELSLLATLHDIGKVAIPEKILLKKGKLTEKEWSVIKRHPEIGFNIAQSSPQIAHISKSILSCHENYDGSGYPLGIRGHAIPVISRIILIVDAYDVMTSRRTYKEPVSKEDAIKELKRCAGSQFDPVLVDKFISIITA